MNTFNEIYYSFSPYIADYERENPVFKEMVKITITPMISSLSILNHVDMNSEQSALGYGISLILLNVGMYAAIPAAVFVGIRKIKWKSNFIKHFKKIFETGIVKFVIIIVIMGSVKSVTCT